MNLSFEMEVNPEINPDPVGEHLRKLFFLPKAPYGWQPGTKELPDIPVSVHSHNPDTAPEDDYCPGCCDYGMVWKRASRNTYMRADYPEGGWKTGEELVECQWSHNGPEVVIAFLLPYQKWLVNDDSKKSIGWYISDEPPE